MLIIETAFSRETDLLEMENTRRLKTFKIWIHLADFISNFISSLSIFNVTFFFASKWKLVLWFGLAEAANEKTIHPVFPHYMLFVELLLFYFCSLFLTLRKNFKTKTWWQKYWTINTFIISDMMQNKEVCSRLISLSSLCKKWTEKPLISKRSVLVISIWRFFKVCK